MPVYNVQNRVRDVSVCVVEFCVKCVFCCDDDQMYFLPYLVSQDLAEERKKQEWQQETGDTHEREEKETQQIAS